MAHTRNVAILIFDDVELLDFCGPLEVFSLAGIGYGSTPFSVYTVAEKIQILTLNQLSVNPRYTIQNCPQPDILIVPGGYGTRREINNDVLIDWIEEVSQKVELVLSVCTGALLLAKAGLLEGQAATTHHLSLELLKKLSPNTIIQENKRYIDNGRIIVAAGISAGIDAALYVVARLLGKERAQETAQYMEYDWKIHS